MFIKLPHNSQNLAVIQISINGRMNKQIVAYSHNGKLSKGKEQATDHATL